MRVYLAGPMSGIPQFNFPAFDEAAKVLRAAGLTVINPAEIDDPASRAAALASPDGSMADVPETWGDFLSRDVKIVADSGLAAIVCLPGWESSRGAIVETTVARLCDVKVLSFPTLDPIETTPPAGEQRITNTQTGGAKGRKLARFDLLPWDALWTVAELYGQGATKYEPRNWERGYDWSLSIGALGRHYAQFAAGQDLDEETGLPHMAAVAFHALALLRFMQAHRDLDDRP